jgi:hypothetical protein
MLSRGRWFGPMLDRRFVRDGLAAPAKVVAKHFHRGTRSPRFEVKFSFTLPDGQPRYGRST